MLLFQTVMHALDLENSHIHMTRYIKVAKFRKSNKKELPLPVI